MSEEAAAPPAPKRRGWKPGQSGNPAGRKKGSRHKALIALDAIGEAASKAIDASVTKAALAGDLRACEIILGRVWQPRKTRPVPFDLPALRTAADLPAAMSSLAASVADGALTPDEGMAVSAVLEGWRKAVEVSDLEIRLAALEAGRQP